MNVFVTGATGFIGSHLAELLHSHGHRLKFLVRRTSNLRWISHIPYEPVEGDLFDDRSLSRALSGVDYVYHLAGITKARTEAEYVRGNRDATANLLKIAASANPGLRRFIHVSSQAAVGPSDSPEPVDETAPCRPISMYGRSKLAAEEECLRMRDALPITIVRPPAVYGPRDKDVFEFFKTMSRGIQPMIGFDDKTVSLIHAADLAKGIVLAGEHEKGKGQTYFISSERFYNWKEVGEVTGRVMGKKAIRVRVPEFLVYGIAAIAETYSVLTRKAVLLNLEKAREVVQHAWTCSIEKAKKDLGYREYFSLEEGIRDTVTWYRKNGWL